MNNNDLKRLRTVIKEEVTSVVEEKLTASEQRSKKELTTLEQRLKREITTSEQRLREEISASEKRLKEEIATSDKRVMADIGSFMEDNLFPMIEEKADKSDIDRLERKLDKVLDRSLDHEARIKAIEQVPVVAHELKVKRTK